MKKILLDFLNFAFRAIAVGMSWLFGGLDSLLIAFIVLIVIDFLTGLIVAKSNKEISSKVGFIGISRKIVMIVFVGLAHILDAYVFHTEPVLRTMTIFFFISNEGISILENAGNLGVPIPQKLKNVLIQLKDTAEKDEDNINN
jgi:toxin secretion/phage lysis holin